ncbi:DUF3667 domain-containing protein [Burkholderiaceae bacterium DAT-1]|nr:DUF3667 domain-containing protein [Burkholderiaceae bacterium DAT-1]
MTDHALTHTHCRNCGCELHADYQYCPACGQETHDEPPTFVEFVHEFVNHYIALEGSLWRSLAALALHPGKLTLAYLEGKKQYFVLPLRLFLTLSFIFFICFKFSGFDPVSLNQAIADATYLSKPKAGETKPIDIDAIKSGKQAPPTMAEVAKLTEEQKALLDEQNRIDLNLTFGNSWLGKRLTAYFLKASEHPEREIPRIVNLYINNLPYAILALQPLFAGILALIYLRRKIPYGAHFVFSLHVHAFWFLCLLVGLTAGQYFWPSFALWIWSNLYALFALKRVYQGGWMSTILRAATLATLHWIALFLVLGVMFFSVLI